MKIDQKNKYVLAFDTSNEVIAIGIGKLDLANRSIEMIAHDEAQAHRASNTQLLPRVDALCNVNSIAHEDIACVCVGRGPGSFTGVRIAIATAKGIACALGIGLVGVSTQDSIAWEAWSCGVRGHLLVASDAMRKEIYPAYFNLDDAGVYRLSPDRVVKAAVFESDYAPEETFVVGDALGKYADILGNMGKMLSQELWTPTGSGLLLAFGEKLRLGEIDPINAMAHDPIEVLPVYTRLSDAEENERARLANPDRRNLRTGVQGASAVEFNPFDVAFAEQAQTIEHEVMQTDAWSASMIEDELPRKDRTWWMAITNGDLAGYAGAMQVDGDMQVLKVAVVPSMRRKGIAHQLMQHIAYDAENLACVTMSLEVRKSNVEAQAFYESMGFKFLGVRPKYYSDGEAAVIMQADVADVLHRSDKSQADKACDDAGQDATISPSSPIAHPLLLAIESSCDETAASVIDGDGQILSDVVSSQIDFHARFGGVVPEIASRKHVEAIVGVTRLALEKASAGWKDLDAVAVTYAPGLVGALVVGVAFAKGAAWAANKKLIGVNHLEGHLYANKLAEDQADSFAPPAIVSLVSGGNTMLVHMKDWQDYEILGATIDDAVGEAFDKVAKALGLPYPGGPHISRLACEGDPNAIDFPRALMHSGDYRFSLSGLKTAVATYIENQRAAGIELNLPDICASFQQAVIDVQVSKARKALDETGATTFCLGGGVAANPALRDAYEKMCAKQNVRVLMPPLKACGDNAAMIALVALDRYKQGKFEKLDMDAVAHADLSQPY